MTRYPNRLAACLLAAAAVLLLAGCGAAIPSLEDRAAFMHSDMHFDTSK
ncbi:hypothetical protein [Jannaschia sp. W003]|nr:hypothetical protein [Jannaschia sp. W003]UWQ20588.1 hypothetical protein K3554_11395 [Jannaschia sp. W003]